MKYGKVATGTFIDRPNRFIANVRVDGTDGPDNVVRVHVKNTGRCRELLVPGHRVVLSCSDSPGRKTCYDLVAVWKDGRLINMDSQAPNRVVGESFGRIVGECDLVRPEFTLGDSRFDFYAEKDGRKILLEVKGVTLEEEGRALFPDAPTERGLKHVTGLSRLAGEGYECWICFLVQMSGVGYMAPNYRTHPEFGRAVEEAKKAGVHVVAYVCRVSEDSIVLSHEVPVRLQ